VLKWSAYERPYQAQRGRIGGECARRSAVIAPGTGAGRHCGAGFPTCGCTGLSCPVLRSAMGIRTVPCQSNAVPRSRRVASRRTRPTIPAQSWPIVPNRPKSRLIVPNPVFPIRGNSRNLLAKTFGVRVKALVSSDFGLSTLRRATEDGRI